MATELSGRGVSGLTIGGGQKMKLDNPFTHIAMLNGGIHLWGNGSVLMIPANAGAYLDGIVARSEETA